MTADAAAYMRHMRAAIALGEQARARGDAPFGARIVAADGRVLAEDGNRVVSAGDLTAHAELAALRRLGGDALRRDLTHATLYASGEPCAMCAGAIAWSGIGRVVVALDAAAVARLDGAAPNAPGIWGRELLARTPRVTVVVGVLADEAAARLWPASGPPS